MKDMSDGLEVMIMHADGGGSKMRGAISRAGRGSSMVQGAVIHAGRGSSKVRGAVIHAGRGSSKVQRLFHIQIKVVPHPRLHQYGRPRIKLKVGGFNTVQNGEGYTTSGDLRLEVVILIEIMHAM